MLSKSSIIFAINRYVNRTYLEPDPKMRHDIFAMRSYRKWAVTEIIRDVTKHPNIPASMVIERFAKKMDDYSCQNRATSVIFSIAHDVAMDLFDEISKYD